MKFILVRHGDVIDPAGFKTPLTAFGVQQSEDLAVRLHGFSGDIYASPYKRCQQTAKIIADRLGLSFKTEAALGEVGYWDGETILQAQTRAIEFMDTVRPLGRDMIFVTHGGIILGLGIAYGHPDGVCDRGQMLQLEIP